MRSTSAAAEASYKLQNKIKYCSRLATLADNYFAQCNTDGNSKFNCEQPGDRYRSTLDFKISLNKN